MTNKETTTHWLRRRRPGPPPLVHNFDVESSKVRHRDVTNTTVHRPAHIQNSKLNLLDLALPRLLPVLRISSRVCALDGAALFVETVRPIVSILNTEQS